MTIRRTCPFRAAIFGCCLFSSSVLAAFAGDPQPSNLGGGLRELSAWHAAQVASLPAARRADAVKAKVGGAGTRIQSDAAGRLVVDVYLDGTAPDAAVRAALEALGARITASVAGGETRAAAHGLFSAFLPLGQAAVAAKLPGVQSVILVHRPWRRVGAATSQGVAVMKANLPQRRKITGAGITVGVISDSFDVFETPTAATDVLRDDLPGTKNRAKHLIPVNVLAEGDPAVDTDEGRAMLQIIHDVAPDSALAFHSVGDTQASFATAIRALRTAASCDVIVDDIGFADEPMFSDGIVAQAVEDVVTSSVLAGPKALYYSAAGNGGGLGYEADFSPVADATVRNGAHGNLDLASVPGDLTAGGFHNFTPASGTTIVQQVVVSNDVMEIDFQWNDLFDPNAMTSDFNVLIFDDKGTYLGNDATNPISGVDHNFTTGQAVEIVDLPAGARGDALTYQLVVARTATGTHVANHFRYTVDVSALGNVGGDFFTYGVPTIVGHPGARDADAVGAYQYNMLKEPESYSSFGPVAIYFDDQGVRLANPEIRQQPTISAPDGVATSLPDYKPFFGTSAAAPHVAGVAALLLEAAGGHGHLTPAQARAALQSTAAKHDLDPLAATATCTAPAGAGTVTITGHGDESNVSSNDPRFFAVEFTGPVGTNVASLTIDLTGAGLKFDGKAINGFPFTVAATSGGVGTVTPKLLPGNRKLLLTFASFPTGGALTFGIDRDLAATSSGGNSGDLLGKATASASLLPSGANKPVIAKGVFVNNLGTGFSPADGFGIVNADAAVKTFGK